MIRSLIFTALVAATIGLMHDAPARARADIRAVYGVTP
jgi:hypothetical protein